MLGKASKIFRMLTREDQCEILLVLPITKSTAAVLKHPCAVEHNSTGCTMPV